LIDGFRKGPEGEIVNRATLIRSAALQLLLFGLVIPGIAASVEQFNVQKLLASDGDSGDLFGASVAIDGNRGIVGAWKDEGFKGAAYVVVREGSTWRQQAKLVPDRSASNYGYSVAIDGDSILVGAPGTGEAAYVYTLGQNGWTRQATLQADDPASNVTFGWSVALEHDTAVVSARNETDTGMVYVFGRNGTTWRRQAKLTDNSALVDDFRYSVTISNDTILIGSRLDDDKDPDAGSAFVFVRSGSA